MLSLLKKWSICLYKLIIYNIIITWLINSTHNYILIQLKKYENEANSNNDEYSPEILINTLYNHYYGFLNVGYPPQKTEIQISIEDTGLIMNESICLTSNYYNKNKSLSLNQTHYYDNNKYSKKNVVVNETIDFDYIDYTNNNLCQKKFPYIFMYNKENNTGEEEGKIEKEKEGKACIILGLNIYCDPSILFCKNIPLYLKERNIINSQNLLFLYHNDKEKEENGGYDASILIGDNPHDFNDKEYNNDNYYKSKALNWVNEICWMVTFRNYYYFQKKQIFITFTSSSDYAHAKFLFNLDIIIGIQQYYNSIKTNYFDKYENKCNMTLVYNRYRIISCDKDFNTGNFPTLYFYQNDYNYTFELSLIILGNLESYFCKNTFLILIQIQKQ